MRETLSAQPDNESLNESMAHSERERFLKAVQEKAARLGLTSDEYMHRYAQIESDKRNSISNTDAKDIFESQSATDTVTESLIHDRIEAEEKQGIDMLTGLSNRRRFEHEMETRQNAIERYQQNMEKRQEKPHEFWMLMIDIDTFKKINDQYGHQAGDRVIQSVAETLESSLRENDFVARVGGEEFAVLIEDDDKIRGDVEIVLGVAERIRLTVEQSIVTVDGNDIPISISIGVSPYQQSADRLKQFSDAALQAAKGNVQAVENQGFSSQAVPHQMESRNQIWYVDPNTTQLRKHTPTS